MKKIFALVLSLTALPVFTQAQTAFKQVGLSIEAGTTGLGVNVSYPLVTDRLIVSAGYNFPNYTYSRNINVGNEYINKQIGQVKNAVDIYDTAIDLYNDLTGKHLEHIGDDVKRVDKLSADIDAQFKFGNFKLMVQYYPTVQSSFYLTAGVFIGGGEMATLTGKIDPEVWNIYLKAVDTNNELRKVSPEIMHDISALIGTEVGPVENFEEAVSFNVGDQTFCIRPEDNGRIHAQLKVNKVKPYLGFGFGNSIPQKHRVGFQMEVGAYYQSKPKLVSSQEIPYDAECIWQKDLADAKDIIQKFSWYPQLTFRFTGRIF